MYLPAAFREDNLEFQLPLQPNRLKHELPEELSGRLTFSSA